MLAAPLAPGLLAQRARQLRDGQHHTTHCQVGPVPVALDEQLTLRRQQVNPLRLALRVLAVPLLRIPHLLSFLPVDHEQGG